jgi:hypothetical protein
MSAVAVNRQQRVEYVVDQVMSAIQDQYPTISAEVVYAPPDEGDAWIILRGVDDPDLLDEIDECGRDIRSAALEQESILVLVV